MVRGLANYFLEIMKMKLSLGSSLHTLSWILQKNDIFRGFEGERFLPDSLTNHIHTQASAVLVSRTSACSSHLHSPSNEEMRIVVKKKPRPREY
jgi:hypothetical protein